MEKWQSEYRDSIKTHAALEEFFEAQFPKVDFPLLIPRKFATHIKKAGLDSPLANQFLPQVSENDLGGESDPIGDHNQSPLAQIVHRYENRILFFPTQVCPVICRYCFRKNELGTNDELFKANFEKVLEYLKQHSEINEIIFSGGDPLILSDERIEFYLNEFKKIPHIKFIRFHTRTPIILPSRITENFCKIIENFKKDFLQINFIIHVNHSQEFNEENKVALSLLHAHCSNLLSQSVLLKGVNNSKQALLKLIDELIKLNIRPYYLHHPDKVKGGLHFMLTLEEGRNLYATLRNHLPGWALPQYIIDIPGGEGKVSAYNPETYNFSGHLINRKGTKVPYI